jgi:hypothetical protein
MAVGMESNFNTCAIQKGLKSLRGKIGLLVEMFKNIFFGLLRNCFVID